ncbi:CLUMA_CG016287, isoform A [Clunio marinus]|uniref:CLUMA_CG016287, isoform A n=1 Tax=Clunio marinus TaxID=568069 RepID=A0A1J1IUU4_9DIPT|nr:CLUMA_CG016287, isoform A [Clunio marinus]
MSAKIVICLTAILVAFTHADSHGSRLCTKGCFDNGNYYAIGDSVPHPDPCHFCTCFESGVECAVADCARPPDGCTPIFIPGQCCPDYDCNSLHASDVNCHDTCTKDGQFYSIGSEIPSDDDPCSVCICSECGNIKCSTLECDSIRFGCKAIYVEGQCCPSFQCDGNFPSFSIP